MQGSTVSPADREIEKERSRETGRVKEKETTIRRGKGINPKREGEDQKPRERESDRNRLEESQSKEKTNSAVGDRLKDFSCVFSLLFLALCMQTDVPASFSARQTLWRIVVLC